MPSKEAQIKAMWEIGKAEIGGAVTKVPLFWRAIAKAECKEEFWDLWGKENEDTIKNFHIVRVLLIGFTSEEHMQYDENVLNDIMKELGAIARPTKPSDESWIKNADSAGMWLMCGSYMSVDYVIETLSQATVHGESYADLKKKYTPPLMPDYGDPGWFQSFELGHQGYSEFLVYWDQDEDTTGVDHFYVETSKMNIKGKKGERGYTVYFVNWFGQKNFKFHVYTKTDEPDPDTGYNFGAIRASRKVIAWGGTYGRSWFYDLSAGPEAWTNNWAVDFPDLDGDGVEDYRMPPIWEYTAGGYRDPSQLSFDLGLVTRFVAIDLLFPTSPLYDPLVTAPGAGGTKVAHIEMFQDDPASNGLDWINPGFAYNKYTLGGVNNDREIGQILASHTLETFQAEYVEVHISANGGLDAFNIQEPRGMLKPADSPLVSMPLETARKLLGVIYLWRKLAPLTSTEERMLHTYATQGALSLERAILAQAETKARILEESDSLKSALLSSVSHELRTPLATFKASVTSLLAGDVDWETQARQDLLETVNEETDHLNRLVGNLLDMSRIEAA